MERLSSFLGCTELKVWPFIEKFQLCPLLRVFFQTSSGELGGVEDGGRLRCLQGKADTGISCVHYSLCPVLFCVCGLWL